MFLLGGIALLVSTLTIALLNRKAVHAENPYDEEQRSLSIGYALAALRHADALYRAGLDEGRRFPRATPERVGESLERLGLGDVKLRRSAKRVDFHVHESPSAGVPQVGEPLCHFTLGILRGAFEQDANFGNVVEEACHGLGSPECVFSMEVKSVARTQATR